MNRYERLRFEHKLTQQQLADGAGISRGTVIRLEQARNPKPTQAVANALADYYEISLDVLLAAEPETGVAA
jgi:transcriptional regulator with XRE-family HTH domain